MRRLNVIYACANTATAKRGGKFTKVLTMQNEMCWLRCTNHAHKVDDGDDGDDVDDDENMSTER